MMHINSTMSDGRVANFPILAGASFIQWWDPPMNGEDFARMEVYYTIVVKPSFTLFRPQLFGLFPPSHQ